MIQMVCSSTLYFVARSIAAGSAADRPVPEVIVDHHSPGDFLYVFEEGQAPAGIDVEAIKLREAQT